MAKVAVLGAGYVGLTTGACLAHIGHEVACAEIDPVKVDKSKGMNITIVTSAKSDDHARFLLRELGMPFNK